MTLKNTGFIVNQLLGNVVELATDKLGLCVMKKCATNPFIINEAIENLLILIQDPYGNYLIQHMLEY